MHPPTHTSLCADGAHTALRTALPSLCAFRNTHRSPPNDTRVVPLLPHTHIAARRFTHVSLRSPRKAHRSALFYKQIALRPTTHAAHDSPVSLSLPKYASSCVVPARCQKHMAQRPQSTLPLRPDRQSPPHLPTHTSLCSLRRTVPPEPIKNTDRSAPAEKHCSAPASARIVPLLLDGGIISIPDERTQHSAASLHTHRPALKEIALHRQTHTSISARRGTHLSSPGDTCIALRFERQTLCFALPRHTRIHRRPWTHTSPPAPAVSPSLCATRKTLHFDTQETQMPANMDLGLRQPHLSTTHESSHCSTTSSRKLPHTRREHIAGSGKQHPSLRAPRL